jgi:hypothetical protein
MATLTREAIIEAAKRVASESGGVLSLADFERLAGISQHQLYKAFPDGGWTEVLQLAGIRRHPQHYEPLSDEELLIEFHRVASELGQIPTVRRPSKRFIRRCEEAVRGDAGNPPPVSCMA